MRGHAYVIRNTQRRRFRFGRSVRSIQDASSTQPAEDDAAQRGRRTGQQGARGPAAGQNGCRADDQASEAVRGQGEAEPDEFTCALRNTARHRFEGQGAGCNAGNHDRPRRGQLERGLNEGATPPRFRA